MPVENSIILVTDDSNIAEILKPKLILLREVDNILTTDYSNAVEKIKNILPEVVLIYCAEEKTKCLELVKALRSEQKTKNISVLLILDKYNQDLLLNAYEEGITDYLMLNADDAEILIRTIWGLKKNAYMDIIHKQNNLLEELDVIDKETGFYTNKYCEKILENEFEKLRETKTEGILILISTSEESKTKLNPLHLAKSIKSSTRNSDLILHGDANRFYLLLEETQLKGAFCVLEKIKRIAGEQYKINASVSNIGEKSFETLKKDLLNALIEAENTNQDLVIVSEEEKDSSDNWLEKINTSQKNFKLFKQAFNKKLEKVIAPVFFQIQKLYEEKLFETKIEQYSNSTLSAFILKKADKMSGLKITYPGFSKINIDVIHEGLDSPENKRINLDMTELDEKRLTQILEDFIQEFKNNTEQD